jgi:hypothetical protein
MLFSHDSLLFPFLNLLSRHYSPLFYFCNFLPTPHFLTLTLLILAYVAQSASPFCFPFWTLPSYALSFFQIIITQLTSHHFTWLELQDMYSTLQLAGLEPGSSSIAWSHIFHSGKTSKDSFAKMSLNPWRYSRICGDSFEPSKFILCASASRWEMV